jgi:hypothetical protein
LRILRGGSAEVSTNKWVKFDVELDESDLQALAVKNGLALESLTVIQKFQLLVSQAELLVTVQMENLGAQGSDDVLTLKTRLKNLIATLPKDDA